MIWRLAKTAKSLSPRLFGGQPLNLGFYGVALVCLIFFLASPPISPPAQGTANSQAISTRYETEPQTQLGQSAREDSSEPSAALSSKNNSSATSERGATRPASAPPSKPDPTAKTVPILMYHYIRVNPDPADVIGAGLSVTPVEFEWQMRYLVDNGYQVIGLTELAQAISNNISLPPRTIVLTFDDGYFDFYQNAYPVLKRYDLKATSFVITDFVGRKGYLTWGAIQEMVASGLVTFGSHTLDHPDLARISVALAAREIKESKRLLEDHLGTHVTLFAYPAGQYNLAVMKLVEETGYVAAVSTRYGNTHTRDDLFRLKRIRIDGRDGHGGFIARLRYVDSGGADVPYVAVPAATAIPTAITKPLATPTPRRTPAPSTTPSTPGTTATVPNLIGLSEAEARGRLSAAGMEAGYTNYQTVDDVAANSKQYFLSFAVGSVVSQQPAPGTTLKRGERVTLAVRKK